MSAGSISPIAPPPLLWTTFTLFGGVVVVVLRSCMQHTRVRTIRKRGSRKQSVERGGQRWSEKAAMTTKGHGGGANEENSQ